VCAAVSKPVNVVANRSFTVDQLSEAGVRRISLGGAFSRTALSAFLSAAREVRERGSFTFLEGVASGAELASFMPSVRG